MILSLAVQSLVSSAGGPMSPQRKALLIIIDAARRAETHDALAASSMPALVDAATTALIAPSCWTLPSVASILTGLFPAEHNMTWSNVRGHCAAPTIADMLASAGRTFRLISGNHIYAPPVMRLPDEPSDPLRWHRRRAGAFVGRSLGLTDYGGRAILREVRHMAAEDELPDLLMLHLLAESLFCTLGPMPGAAGPAALRPRPPCVLPHHLCAGLGVCGPGLRASVGDAARPLPAMHRLRGPHRRRGAARL